MKQLSTALLLPILSIMSASALANNTIGAAAKISTLGLGGEVSYAINDQFSVAAGFNALNLDREMEESDIDYDGEISLSTFGISGRYHPWSSGFFVGAGLNVNGNKISLKAKPKSNATYEFNGKTYSINDVASANAKLGFENLAPQLSIGWQSMQNESLSFFTELGVMFSGKPEVSYSVNCAASLPTVACNQLKSDVEAEKKDLEKDLDGLEIWPILAIGLQYNF